MGLSGSKQTTTQNQTSTTGPSELALPKINQASDALTGAYNQTQPIAANIGDVLGGMFTSYKPTDTTGLTAAKAANDALLTGGGANPELDNIIRTSNNSVADKINALFSRSGQTGSSRQLGELAKQLSANESNLRYTDFNNQQTRMQQAIANAMGLTSAGQAATTGDIANLLNLGTGAVSIPGQPAAQLASGLGGLWGNATTTTGSGTSTTKTSGSIFDSLLKAGANAATAIAAGSDRRLKTNVEKVGELPDGLGVYEFDYLPAGGEIAAYVKPGRHRGVMADEVATLRPWALGPVIDGYSTVHYGAL